MKFLCPQCKAKYQIADDKIEGRTLRMKCRRCEHEIVVKGDLAIADSVPPPAAAPKPAPGRAVPAPRAPAGPTVGARRPAGAALAAPAAPAARAPQARGAGSALGADFRRQMGAGSPEPSRSPAATPLDAWHVAIHEVPVGPMKREELARKIAAGAVNGESLCWREGFDDWRPLRDVAELSQLLRRPTNPPPAAARPPAPRTGPSAGRPVPAARPGAAPAGRGQAPAQRPNAASASTGRGASPAARSNVVPIGGRLGAAAAPAFEEEPDDFDEATVVAQSPLEFEAPRASEPDPVALGALVASSRPPAAAAAPVFETPAYVPPPQVNYSEPPRRKKAISPFVWIALAGAMVFAITLALAVAPKLLQQAGTPVPIAAVIPPVAPPTTAPEAPIAIPDTLPETQPAEVVPPVGPATTGHTKRTNSPPHVAGARTLTAAEQAAIDRMTGGGSGTPNIQPPVQRPTGDGPAAQGAELSAAQLRTVVQRNRPGLQHCYEMAARQTGSSEPMRANIDIAVGGSGVVTRTTVTGGPGAPPALMTCIEGQVRRWHFPAGGEATFPIVFSPGG